MKKKIISIVVCLAVVAAAGVGLYLHFRPDPADGTDAGASPSVADNVKTVTLTISADGKSETYNVETQTGTLGAMLVREGYVKNDRDSYGLYIKTVYGPFENGRTVDVNKEEWWSISKDGEMLMTGADQTEISDGEKYELSLRTGYDSF